MCGIPASSRGNARPIVVVGENEMGQQYYHSSIEIPRTQQSTHQEGYTNGRRTNGGQAEATSSDAYWGIQYGGENQQDIENEEMCHHGTESGFVRGEEEWYENRRQILEHEDERVATAYRAASLLRKRHPSMVTLAALRCERILEAMAAVENEHMRKQLETKLNIAQKELEDAIQAVGSELHLHLHNFGIQQHADLNDQSQTPNFFDFDHNKHSYDTTTTTQPSSSRGQTQFLFSGETRPKTTKKARTTESVKSRFKGVYGVRSLKRGTIRWTAKLLRDNVWYRDGSFTVEEEAAKAVDARLRDWGRDNECNFDLSGIERSQAERRITASSQNPASIASSSNKPKKTGTPILEKHLLPEQLHTSSSNSSNTLHSASLPTTTTTTITTTKAAAAAAAAAANTSYPSQHHAPAIENNAIGHPSNNENTEHMQQRFPPPYIPLSPNLTTAANAVLLTSSDAEHPPIILPRTSSAEPPILQSPISMTQYQSLLHHSTQNNHQALPRELYMAAAPPYSSSSHYQHTAENHADNQQIHISKRQRSHDEKQFHS